MGTEIKFWQISNNHAKAVDDSQFASEHLESELEKWIVECPDMLGDDVLIIASQKDVPGVGRLDLLAIQRTGELVIVELKRDMDRREAVAQALDYASWLDSLSETDVFDIAQEFLLKPLDEAFSERFGVDLPSISPRNHRILLVGAGLDAAAERIINYLAQRHSMNINAVFFRYAKLSGGQEILARSVLVAESVLQSGKSSRNRPTVSELLQIASSHGALSMVEAFRTLAKDDVYVWEEPQSTYGGSFRYWRRN